MHAGQFVFSQLLEFLPRFHFRQCVQRYQGNRRTRSFSCFDQFLVMAFAQLTFRESLRDLETCLRCIPQKLYHIGLRGSVARSTIADANEKRPWQIWSDLAGHLIDEARSLYLHDPFELTLAQSVYAFDSTTIDLSLTLFPWCPFRNGRSAVKLHTLLDLRGSIPCFVAVTGAAIHDVNLLDQLAFEPGSYYLLDRGYQDFARLYRFTQEQAFFVTRAKRRMDYVISQSRPVDHSLGLRTDQSIRLAGKLTCQKYPELLRRVSFVDPQTPNATSS